MATKDLKELRKPLSADEIDFRIQSINKGGYATILAYKDARVDINRLNSVCTPLGWRRLHTRDNHNCIVSIWDEDNKHWVDKEDTGAESFTEKEKGLASDSFKRACFNWGIGIELYDYPVIQIKLNKNEYTEYNGKVKQTWDLKLRDWVWTNKFNKDGVLTYLQAKDEKGNIRFTFELGKDSKSQSQYDKTSPKPKASSSGKPLTDAIVNNIKKAKGEGKTFEEVINILESKGFEKMEESEFKKL